MLVILADMDQENSCSSMFKAGISGYNALRAVFSSLVRRPMMLGIMAFMDQKDSGSVIYYAGVAGDNAPRAVFLGLQAHDARHHGRFGPEGQSRYGAHGQTVQTVESPQLQSIQVVDISFAAQRQSLMVQTVCQTIDILQLLYKVVDVPVSWSSRFTSPSWRRGRSIVQTVRLTKDIPQLLNTAAVVPVVRSCSSRIQTWRRQLSSHSCSSSFCVDTVVHIPVVVQRQMPCGSDHSCCDVARLISSWR